MASPITATTTRGQEGVDGVIQRMRAVYPFLVRVLHEGASDEEYDTIEREKKQVEEEERAAKTAHPPAAPPRWPYFFAYADGSGGANITRDEFVAPLQQRFLEAWAGVSRPLLVAWIDMCRVVTDLVDRRVEHAYLDMWSGSAFTPIREALLRHPQIGQLTDLASLLPIVERELADARSKPRSQQQQQQQWRSGNDNDDDAIRGYNDPVMHWDFYRRLFLPGPSRLSVPLPAGLVLFEGRSSISTMARPSATDILRDRVRRTAFSTSWHINAALAFVSSDDDSSSRRRRRRRRRAARDTLLVHKIMSDAILGVDVQQTRSRTQRLGSWHECEVIVQPLVSFHQVQEADVLLDQRWGSRHRQWIHVIFTHAFLGDVCPCEAQAEAAETAATDPLGSEAKRRRLQGRLQLD